MKDSYSCIVIGGGPAGSTVAALTAEAGHDTLLLERDKMPRFHVGESLMPETYWTLDRLGMLDKMRRSDFVKKLSVQFVTGSGKESQPFFFRQHDDRECSQTWQVERAKFDHMLFENAADKGADCRDGVRVLDVLFEGDRATGVKVKDEEGEKSIAAQVVVDATGQQSLVASRLGLRRDNPKLRKAAIWGYYRDARRDPGENAGATIIMHTRHRKTWFWFIPLSDNVTSVGVVGDNDYLLKRGSRPPEVFEEELVECPGLCERLMNASFEGKFHVAKEFSYTTTRHAGEGWVLVGDAFGFIDPIYSSGVFLALKSGEMAADAINDALRSGDTSPAVLGRWAEEFKKGVHWVHRLVSAYYTDGFSFGQFMKEHPQHQGNLTDLLIGRVYHDEAGRIFDDMQPWLDRIEAEHAAENADEKVEAI